MFREVAKIATSLKDFEMLEEEYNQLENRDQCRGYLIGRADGQVTAPPAWEPAGAFYVTTQNPRQRATVEPVKMKYKLECLDAYSPILININNISKFVPVTKYYYNPEQKKFVSVELWEVHCSSQNEPQRNNYGDFEYSLDLIKPFNLKELK